MPPVACRKFLFALVAALVLSGPIAAQDVAPPDAPDVTTLPAPNGDSSGGDTTLDTEAPAAEAPPCGTQTITIARMAWPSAALLAEIDARLLKAAFACTVQVIPADLAPALSGMVATGQPAVAPEMWIARAADQWNQAVKGQKVRQVGLSYTGNSFEGWYMPDYVAAAHPELKAATALEADWQVFAKPGATKGTFISCPADWACAVINRNLLKALGLEAQFDIVEPKNRFDLDQIIAAAVNRKEAILFYYWQPNATLAQFGFKPVDLGPYDKEAFACLGQRNCPAPKPSSFAPEPVVIALASWVFTGAPEIAAFFQRTQMPLEEMNKLLAQLNEGGATVEAVADRFVAERQDLWQKWVGTPAGATSPEAGEAQPPLARKPAPPPVVEREAPLSPSFQSVPPPTLTQSQP